MTQGPSSPSNRPDTVWPPEGLERVRRCTVCGSQEREPFHEGLTDNIFFCAPGLWSLYRCQRCSSAYLDPRPTPETIHLAYESYYTHHPKARASSEDLGRLRLAVRSLANGYRNARYGGHLEPASRLGAFVLPAAPPLRRALDQELRRLPRVTPGARLLDVGFGDGRFLQLAERIGWEVVGVDPDPHTVESARQHGLDVHPGGIEDLPGDGGRFDVITLNHVIEHVHSPRGTLSAVFGLLKPGGLISIETPNIDAAGHLEFDRYWRGLEPPRHLTLFTWEALESLLREVGFSALRRTYRHEVYPHLAAASRAIREGKDPYERQEKSLQNRWRAAWSRMTPRRSGPRSEFINLTARKAGD